MTKINKPLEIYGERSQIDDILGKGEIAWVRIQLACFYVQAEDDGKFSVKPAHYTQSNTIVDDWVEAIETHEWTQLHSKKALSWGRWQDRMHDYFMKSENVVDDSMELNCCYFIQQWDKDFEVYLDDHINPIDHILVARGTMSFCLQEAEIDINRRLRGEIVRDSDGNLVKAITKIKISGDDIRTVDDFWDCQCSKDYTHNKQDTPVCHSCDFGHEECPDSRASEVLTSGMLPKGYNGIELRDGQHVQICDVTLEWFKTQCDSGEAVAFVRMEDE